MDEFDVYFQRAKLDEDLGVLQQATYTAGDNEGASARRGSVPNITLTPEPNFHHKRTLSCRTPARRRGNVSPRGARSPSRRSHAGSHSLLSETTVPEVIDEDPRCPSPNPLLTPPPDSAMSTSRSGSFRKRNPRIDKELQELQVTPHNESRSRRSSLQDEDEAALKMEKIRLLEQEDLCVVRSFSTSSRGLVNRGDSVKRKKNKGDKEPLPLPMETVSETANGYDNPTELTHCAPTANVPSQSNSSGRTSGARRVLFLGEQGVGKSALINQFLTSDYIGAATDPMIDDKAVHTMSVEIDGEETMMDLVEIKPSKTFPSLGDADALVFIYAIDEHRSFVYIQDMIQEVRRQDNHNGAVIMVANKADLVRSRDVEEEEAYDVCRQYDSKFIEVSCAINHKVDEMLVGIVTQIRLNKKRRANRPRRNADGTRAVSCLSSARVMLKKMFGTKKEVTHHCDNLLVL